MARYDLHTHLFHTWETGKGSLEFGSRSPDSVFSAIAGKALNGIGLANYSDWRYEKFANSVAASEGEYKLVKDIGNAIQVESGSGLLSIIKAQEIPMQIKVSGRKRQAHMLALGLPNGINIDDGKDLVETCRQIHNLGALAVPAHWWSHYGLGKQLVLDNAGLLDAIEVFNANCKRLKPEEIGEVRAQTGLAGLYVSDSHNRKDLGNGYVLCQDFDFSSRDNLIGSMKERFKFAVHPAYGTTKRNPLTSLLEHLFFVNYDCRVRRPLGWLEQPVK